MKYGPTDEPICGEYLKLWGVSYALSTSMKYVLTIFNYLIRLVVITTVTWIGYATETAQLERITTVTFLCQFFNTAFILLLVNADLSEQPYAFTFTGGNQGDFNAFFFASSGNTLVSTMIFNSYYPIIDFGIYWLMRVLFRCLDRPCCSLDKT
jgi:hypothetical protein